MTEPRADASASAGPVRVTVLDYGSGNLNSACRAVEAVGATVTLATPTEVSAADALVVPGVGAFAACMAGLEHSGGVALVRDWVAAGRPVLGICVGHQVFFERGTEHGTSSAGLGVWPGSVDRLTSRRLPHMGWNTVDAPTGSVLFDGLAGERFYFVHSYGAHEVTAEGPEAPLVTFAEHGGDRFVAAVERGPLSTVQFHPEKSGAAGARLLRNWLGVLHTR